MSVGSPDRCIQMRGAVESTEEQKILGQKAWPVPGEQFKDKTRTIARSYEKYILAL